MLVLRKFCSTRNVVDTFKLILVRPPLHWVIAMVGCESEIGEGALNLLRKDRRRRHSR